MKAGRNTRWEGTLQDTYTSIADTPWGAFIDKRLAPGEAFGWHTHSTATLTLTVSGEYAEDFGRRLDHIPQGSVQFKPSGVPHTTVAGADGARMWCFLFGREGPTSDLDACVIDDALAPARMMAAAQAARSGRHADARRRIGEVIGSEARVAPPRPEWLERVAARVETSCTAESLAELAAAAGVHPVYLARAFRRHYGCSIGVHRQRHRISLAVQRLVHGREPLADLALGLGFCDQSHFTRTFGRLAGVSPARFRRLLG